MNSRCARNRGVAISAAIALSVSLAGVAPQAFAGTSTSTEQSTPFGPGCSALRHDAQTARQRVTTAVANNPNAAMFVGAVRRAHLSGMLDNTRNITVFVPTNAAFDRLGKAKVDALLNNEAQLKKLIEYHVVEKSISPAELPNGSFTTAEGGILTTSGSGTSFTVNHTAPISCGDITTANGKLYIIDGVLTPPS